MNPDPRSSWLSGITPYGALLAIGVALGFAVEHQKHDALDTARSNFRHESARESRILARKIENKFQLIYQGIRTLARLPNVRQIDRYAKTFNDDARASAQEIYNNLAQNVAVSEVYIVPVDFNPDRIDPVTNELEVPIIEFDELIVGRIGEGAGPTGSPGTREPATRRMIHEIEIYEYRLMREQIAKLRSRYPNERRITRLSYPAIAGREVITCDNTQYSLRYPDDADRKGMVYSVPFYGTAGELRGIVSAIILTNAIRKLLPDEGYRLSNPTHGYEVAVRQKRDWKVSSLLDAASAPPQPPIYSEQVGLGFPDMGGGWVLHAQRPNALFWTRPDTLNALDKARGQLLLLLLAMLAGSGIIYVISSQRRTIQMENARLEIGVAERTMALEEALTTAKRASAAKSDFLARMSHEIRTPVSGILGLSNLLSRTQLDSEQRRQTHLLKRSADILLHLVNDVLDISKVEAGEMKGAVSGVNLHKLLHTLVSTCQTEAESKGLGLSVDVSDDVPQSVIANHEHLERVLINLIGNAVKFTEQGSVRISVRAGPVDETKSARLVFEISDTGIGIDPSKTATIFAPFGQADESITRRYGGTGLGLSISHALVLELGGELTFDSVPGGGTTFRFAIPLIAGTDDEPGAGETPGDQVAQPALSIAVLLVEDNPINREIAQTYLEDCGCNVDTAVNGCEALAQLPKRDYDVILMDCQMPEMDGFEATRRIRAREREHGRKPVPIIALTAHALTEDEAKCKACGMTDYLSKPFTAEQLMNAIRTGL